VAVALGVKVIEKHFIIDKSIRSVRPEYGMHPKYLKDVLGKVADRDYGFWG